MNYVYSLGLYVLANCNQTDNVSKPLYNEPVVDNT